MIKRYDYDKDMQVLHVQFTSGRIASLQSVPQTVVNDFLAAPSKGKFFHANLRDQYAAL
jgi:lysyl-tRNA synthetase class 2